MNINDSEIGDLIVDLVDGAPVVRRADPVILVALNLLAEGQQDGTIRFLPESGEYIFAGQVTYRLSRLDGSQAVMSRVRDLR